MKNFTFYSQLDQMDCGPTCLRMVAKDFGRSFKSQTLREYCDISRNGASLFGISNAAERIGLRTLGVRLTVDSLKDIDLPCILHWGQNHYVVLYKVKSDRFSIADPANAKLKLTEAELTANWVVDKDKMSGVALLLSPTPTFYEQEEEKSDELSWKFLLQYLANYKQLLVQLLLGLFLGTLLELVAPFLTQSIVDIGINTLNLNFIHLVIIAQAILIVGRVSVEFIRSWVLLHISSRVNISILTDFLIKLMRLPISFFDIKTSGDIIQRINDQRRIEIFLTGPALGSLFSIMNLVVFSLVLAYYKMSIFIFFTAGSLLHFGWIMIFLKQRRILDNRSFEIAAKNQNNLIQLVGGMQEIKLNNFERQKRWEWEHVQAQLFKYNLKGLSLSQYQNGGALLINEFTNLLITLLSAEAVINGQLTLGGMLAIQFIIGQLNSPVRQLVGFIQGFQDAKISLERLNEIHQTADEELQEMNYVRTLPENRTIEFDNISFRYPGAGNELVLENISFAIPMGKTTAIVGMSGSGKTTLLKLLLRFYQTEKGQIRIGNQPINKISFDVWRDQCGAVMQDGFIFSDNIANNIAIGDELVDQKKLDLAIRLANLQDFIDSLPLGLLTKIGADGNGISQGQRQRILIARAIYKNPHFIFFDEATNALDATNELTIIGNLKEFLKQRTVLVIAHRLTTVKDADNIIVLGKGRILEQGSHDDLIASRGNYYNLVKNQLELGS